MNVSNTIHPSPDQAKASFGGAEDGPMCMVNLLKFKDQATYPDGSEPELSGRDAYLRYGAGVQACLAAVGRKAGFSGMVTGPDAGRGRRAMGHGRHRRIPLARGDAANGPVAGISGDHQASRRRAGRTA